jgi:hypothetical protein
MSLFDGKDDEIGNCGVLLNPTKYTVKVGLHGNTDGQTTWSSLLKGTDDIIGDDKYKSMTSSGEINKETANIPYIEDVNIESKTDINDFICDFNNDKSLYENGLSSLNKVWGGGTETFNNGCVSENVFIPCSKIKVVYADILNRKPEFKKVLQLEAHGDKYTGNVKGLEQNKMTYKKFDKEEDRPRFDIPTCPQTNYLDHGRRVGGVVSTNRNFGPGSYEVIARVPKTSAPTGRGYVFAMWTFHYEEHYSDKEKDKQFVKNMDYPKYNPDDDGNGEYCIINHEIDIEIPANPAKYLDAIDGKKLNQNVFKWNTMNMNTWIGDNLEYNETAWYREIVAIPKNLNNTFISENGEFHSYKFIWCVPSSGEAPYVDFYFDNEIIYREKCFVPSRSGKFLVGPWFGWWGFDQNIETRENEANFDTVSVLVSEINIIPDVTSKIVEYPQNYDQTASYFSSPYGAECEEEDVNNCPKPKKLNISCDFEQTYINPCITCNTVKSNLWIWLLIIICCIIIIVGVIIFKRSSTNGVPLTEFH